MKRTLSAIVTVIVATFASFTAKAQAPVSFAPQVVYNVGKANSDFTGLAVADLTGDGKPEVVITDGNTKDTTWVLTNNGDGTYGSAVAHHFGSVGIVAADFNNDKSIDLAVAQLDSVWITLNNGAGGFLPVVRYFVGNAISGMVAKDLNGDNIPDLAMPANLINYVLAVLINKGNGTFNNEAIYSADYYLSFNIAAGDLNGDKKQDLVIPFSSVPNTDSVSVYLNNGTGVFPNNYLEYMAGGAPFNIITSDLNTDGYSDIIVSSSGYDSIEVLISTGSGFDKPVSYPISYVGTKTYSAGSLDTADFNQDGFPDLVVGGWGNGSYNDSIFVFLNKGNGQFAPALKLQAGKVIDYIAARDVNGDGLTDIVVINLLDNTFSVFIQNNIATAIIPPLYKNDIKVYPNPVSGALHIDLPWQTGTGTVTLTLFNIIGKEVLSKTETGNRLLLDVSAVTKGLYWLSIEGVGISAGYKIVVE